MPELVALPRADENPLVGDYVRGLGPVRALFAQDPWPQEWAGGDGFPGDRRALADCVVAHNRRLGAAPAALAAAAALAEPGTVAVVAGQQPGLLTGPLYTVFKAAAALSLARQLGARGQRAVAVFWVASEDHDWAEVNHTYILDREYRLRRLVAEPDPEGSPPVASLPLPANWESLVETVLALAPASEFAGELDRGLRWAAAAGGFSAWCQRLLVWLFSDLGLVLFDPSEPPAKQLAASVLQEAVAGNDGLVRAFLQGCAQVAAGGYPLQVEKSPDSTHLFLVDGGQRRALRREREGGFRAGERRLSPAELQRIAASEPERLSPDVVLRPALAASAIPTAAVVAGPGEVAYYAQLGQVFAYLGVPMPAVWPRPPLTLIEPPVARYLQKLGLCACDLTRSDTLVAARERLLAARGGAKLGDSFGALTATVRAAYERLRPELEAIDRGLGQLSTANLDRVLAQVSWLERRARQELERSQGVLLGQLDRVGAAAWPRGKPQERTLNVLPYVLRHGRAWLRELAAEPLDGRHQYMAFL